MQSEGDNGTSAILDGAAGRKTKSDCNFSLALALCSAAARYSKSLCALLSRNHTQPRHVTSTAKASAILRFVSLPPSLLIRPEWHGTSWTGPDNRSGSGSGSGSGCAITMRATFASALTSVAWRSCCDFFHAASCHSPCRHSLWLGSPAILIACQSEQLLSGQSK